MRACAAVLLGISLAASPLFARNANETGKEEATPAAASVSGVPDKPVPVKAEPTAIESEMQDLRSLVEEQRAELEEQRAALNAQQLKMEELENRLHVTAAPSEAEAAPAPASPAAPSEPAISATAATSATFGAPAAAKPAEPQGGSDEVSPLQLKIGSAYITPVGFMDFTGVFRSKTGGSGIGTNFGSIPYNTAGTLPACRKRLASFFPRLGLAAASTTICLSAMTCFPSL